MKPTLLIIVMVVLLGCGNSPDKTANVNVLLSADTDAIAIANVEVLKSELVLNQIEGVWYYNNQPYNGYSLKFHKNDLLKEKLGFFKGKRQGQAKTWSERGVLRTVSFYNQNKLTGVYKSYWENGNLALQVHYKDGKKQGEEKQWYPNGTLAKQRWLEDGKEKGMQKAWLSNGKLYVNYEVKNGRVFGLMRSNSCYKLENEKVTKKI